jgi:penicillin-binding protein 1C
MTRRRKRRFIIAAMKANPPSRTTALQIDNVSGPDAATSNVFLKQRPWLRRSLFASIAGIALLLLVDRLFPPRLPTGSASGMVINADDGRPLRAFPGEGGVWRMPVAIEDVSPLYIDALLAYEDRWFWQHPGINPAAFMRATWQAVTNGRVVSGGSTLTMQVARILEPPAHRRSALGKIRQTLRALQLEWHLSKREILALYLNHAPFGGTIEGVAAASWAYLGKPPSQLSHAEAALLVVLPQAPSRNRPDRHADRARIVRDKVIGRMRALGEWDSATTDAALQEPVVSRQLKPPVHAALLAERLRRGDRAASRIDTLIDADLQMALEQRVENALSRLPPATSAAVLVVENESLAVRAYVGSGAYADPARLGHVDMVVAQRSPGSTLKPFLYGMALDDGLIHSASLLVDAPQSFDGYRPANFDQGFRGPVTAADALRLSLNVPAVDLLDRVGPARFASRLAHAGVALKLPRGAEPNLSMILGGTATSLESLVGAYAALGRHGMAGQPRYRRDDPVHERRLISAGAAFIVREMLREPAPPGTTLAASLREDALVAKTGTSWGYRDAWAIGVRPGWTLGVWIGRPDGTPMPGQYGAVTALPLLKSVAAMLPRRGSTAFTKPENVDESDICWPLGAAPDADLPSLCARRQRAWILDGVVPATLPDRIAPNAARVLTMQLDEAGRRRHDDCAGGAILHDVVLPQWPILTEPWLGASSAQPLWAPGCERGAPANTRGLDLDGLHEGTTLKPAPGGDGIARVYVTAKGGDGEIWWLIDDQVAATGRDGIAQVLAFPGPGAYRVLAIDRSGNHASVHVRVLR